jgi:hypothetical protein
MNERDSSVNEWPVGIHLRFKVDAALQPQYISLRGTPVLVLSRSRMTDIPEGRSASSMRQDVFSYALGRMGAALPSQLEPIPDRRRNSEQRSDNQRVEE